MALKKLELKPDRSLIDPNFDSYKLSLESVPCFEKKWKSTIRTCSQDQYSFLHAELFAHANLLVMDPYNPDNVYLLDMVGNQVCKVLFDSTLSAPPEIVPVWTMPTGDSVPNQGDYNASLAFASDFDVVISNGAGVIFIVETGDRSKQTSEKVQKWQTVFHEEICGNKKPFAISSARAIGTEGDAEKVINCVLHYVEDKSKVEGLKETVGSEAGESNVHFVNIVEWMTFARGSTCWGLDRVRRFAFFTRCEYLELSTCGRQLICATEKSFQHVYDSSGTLTIEKDENKVVQNKETPKLPPQFAWHQGVEDMVVWVPLPDDITKREIKVTLKPRELDVSIKGEKKIGGELWNVLDSDTMTWTIQKGKLEITLCKANEGLIWQKFFKDVAEDERGEEISNPQAVDDFLERSAALLTEHNAEPLHAYNSQQLEDCDALPEDSFALSVINEEAQVTHKLPLSSHQWLFNLYATVPASLCLRHDVDALIWRPITEKTDIQFDHAGTFSALGYVQASKTQRKFTLASPNFGYAVIVETNRRIFVYRQPSNIPSEFDLRNRKSGEKVKQVAKQQLITLDNNDDILGVAATDKTLMVMTTSAVLCYKMAF